MVKWIRTDRTEMSLLTEVHLVIYIIDEWSEAEQPHPKFKQAPNPTRVNIQKLIPTLNPIMPVPKPPLTRAGRVESCLDQGIAIPALHRSFFAA